jgi:prepilin peptidase CpaA
MAQFSLAAAWFLPFVLPIAIFVAFSDLKRMKIPNIANYALLAVFVVVGIFVLPLPTYAWAFSHLVVVLVFGILFNAAGVLGAGDAKFMAASAPFVALADLTIVMGLLAACLLGAFATHRAVKHSPLRRMVPDWESWNAGRKFPMGFPLAATLVFYLMLAAYFGA